MPCKHRVKVDCHRFLDEAMEMTDLVWEVIVALDPYLQHFMLITVLVFDLIWDMNWGLAKKDMLDGTVEILPAIQKYLNIGPMEKPKHTQNDDTETDDGSVTDIGSIM
jgi:hypothetical protein